MIRAIPGHVTDVSTQDSDLIDPASGLRRDEWFVGVATWRCRSRFWREDVRWFGARGPVDLSSESRAFAFALDGRNENDVDLYVMINMGPGDIAMEVQVGKAEKWRRVIDTGELAPNEIVSEAEAQPMEGSVYDVRSRSIVVFLRDPRCS